MSLRMLPLNCDHQITGMGDYIVLNGKRQRAGHIELKTDDRILRYGDGIFETIAVAGNRILYQDLHFTRLFSSLQLFGFKISSRWSTDMFVAAILSLCEANNLKTARVRLTISRGAGHPYAPDPEPWFMIEAVPMPVDALKFNEEGLVIDIYPDANKSCDRFSNAKSANYLPYIMAAQFAMERQISDAVVLNQYNRICDASIANIFIIQGNELLTPHLSEGPVSGIIRQYISEKISLTGMNFAETTLTEEMLLSADEIFLTNVIYPIRWVQRFRDRSYGHQRSRDIFNSLFKHLS